MFCMSHSQASQTFDFGLNFIHNMYAPGLSDIKRWHKYVPTWAATIHAKSSGAMRDVWGFIDVNCRVITRPSSVWVHQAGVWVKVDLQRHYYSGYKKDHCLKFQAVSAPCGLIIYMSSAFPGSRTDAVIWTISQLQMQILAMQIFLNRPYCLFGDDGYPRSVQLAIPFSGLVTPLQRIWNFFYVSRSRHC